MDLHNMPKIAVIAIVSIVVLIGFTIPLINGMTETIDEEYIGHVDGFQRYEKVDTFTLEKNFDENVIYLNGVPYLDIAPAQIGAIALAPVITDKLLINHYTTASSGSVSLAGLCVEDNAAKIYGVFKISLENGTLTGYNALGTASMTITGVGWAYIPSVDGPYMAVDMAETPALFKAEDELVQWTSRASNNFGLRSGTYDAMTVNFAVVSSVATDTYGDLLAIETDVGKTAMMEGLVGPPQYIMVPYTYTYIDTADTPETSMVGLIPLILLIGLVIGIIGYACRQRGAL